MFSSLREGDMVGAKLHGNCKIEYFSSVATVFFLGIIKRENSWTETTLPKKYQNIVLGSSNI